MRTPSLPDTDASLQKTLARYAVPQRGRAVSNQLTSVTPYVGLIGAACIALRFSPWVAGGLSVIAAGFLLRTFMVFHDCAHNSFLPFAAARRRPVDEATSRALTRKGRSCAVPWQLVGRNRYCVVARASWLAANDGGRAISPTCERTDLIRPAL
jgi:hypothetical protein